MQHMQKPELSGRSNNAKIIQITHFPGWAKASGGFVLEGCFPKTIKNEQKCILEGLH